MRGGRLEMRYKAGKDKAKITIVIKYEIIYMELRLLYLHLTLMHCKGQGQDHLDEKFLGNGDV